MYDFLGLFPHANASHSLIHYLNQHKRMHVAPYTSIWRSIDDVLAYERHFRPFVPTIGVATKDYDTPDIVRKILEATKRDIVVQTVRDPVESFVAQVNNDRFQHKLNELLGKSPTKQTVEMQITDAVTRYITPYAAEVAYEVDTFKRHILVDVEDLKGGKAETTVRKLWRELIGNDDPANQITNVYKPIGARSFAQLRASGFSMGAGMRHISVRASPAGDLWLGYFEASSGEYRGSEVWIHTYPDASQILPSLKLDGALHVAVMPAEWFSLHPVQRELMRPELVMHFENYARQFDKYFAAAEAEMTFTESDFTPAQRDQLAAGIARDFIAFRARHPEMAGRWSVTRRFLGL